MHPRRSITRAGLVLGTAALLGGAVPAGALAAQDLRSPDARDAARQATVQDLRSPDARDAAARIVQVSPGGFDWGDAAIGAGGALGLILVLSGGTFAVARRRAEHRAPGPVAS
jgi:hypothetical protein